MRPWTNFESRSAALALASLSYRTAGAGRPVVFLHGAGGLRYSPAAALLAGRCQVFQPVLPGFDGSDYAPGIESIEALASVVADFIAAVAPGGKAAVVGHSFGGRLAAWLALSHPHRVEALVLECPAGFGLKEAPSKDPAVLRRQLYVRADEAPPEDKTEEVVRRNRLALERYGLVARDETLVSRLAEIALPTLIVFGTEERLIDPGAARLLNAGIRGSFLVYVHDAAHNMDVDQPQRTADAIARFLFGAGTAR